MDMNNYGYIHVYFFINLNYFHFIHHNIDNKKVKEDTFYDVYKLVDFINDYNLSIS